MENKKEKFQRYCLFCDPSKFKQENQILLKSNNFYLFAGLGPIVEGYIIITPYSCEGENGSFHSFADLKPEHIDEVIFLREIISRFYKENYKSKGGGMHFEHGRTPVCIMDSVFTKHCHHAHLCCFPQSESIWNNIENLKIKQINGFSDLASLVQDSSYLFVQNSLVNEKEKENSTKREKWESRIVVLNENDEIPSQFLRRLLAKKIGSEDLWDWDRYPRKDLVNKLVIDFNNWFEKNSEKYTVKQNENGIFCIDFVESIFKTNVIGNDSVASTYFKKWKGLEQYNVIGRFLNRLPEYSISDKDPIRPKILDAGCGPGTYLRVFNDLGLKCIGIDISEEMLKISGELISCEPHLNDDYKLHNIQEAYPQLYKMNIIQPDFPQDTFDGIWCSAVFVHLPKIKVLETLKKFYSILKPNGILYLSAQSGGDSIVRPEGRMYIYYSIEELKDLFKKIGFTIIEQWDNVVSTGTFGDDTDKIWRQFIVKKDELTLKDLGERNILEHIFKLLPKETNQDIIVGIGDDCAGFKPIKDEIVVVTSDPCPKPVITYFEEIDYWYYGWFSMIINISDLGAMGAKPTGILLALEANNDMSLKDLDRFYEGIIEASKQFCCPIIGGNIKDSQNFNSVCTAFGSVHPENVLRRDMAKPGELVIVLGDMGLFWSGTISKLFPNLVLNAKKEEYEKIQKNLKRPVPRIKEGIIIASNKLSHCAMDSSDGLISTFYGIAKSSHNVDIHIDLTNIEPEPIVKEISDSIDIDYRKVMLSWGDWELVCTILPENLPKLQKLMDEINCPLYCIGKVEQGTGKVLFKDHDECGELNYIASERFTKFSYFSHGIKDYFIKMQKEPLYIKVK